MSAPRKCDAVGCTAMIRVGRFMCIDHWRMVPLQQQRTINARFRANANARDLLADKAYLEACATAIEALHRSPADGTHPNPYRRILNTMAAKNGGAV